MENKTTETELSELPYIYSILLAPRPPPIIQSINPIAQLAQIQLKALGYVIPAIRARSGLTPVS